MKIPLHLSALLLLVFLVKVSDAQDLQVKKNAKIRSAPSGKSSVIERVPKGTILVILKDTPRSSNKYFRVKSPSSGQEGWILMSAVNRLSEDPLSGAGQPHSLFGTGQVPADYYSTATGLEGDALKLALHRIIRNHKPFTYHEVYSILEETDRDPCNAKNVVLLYSGRTVPYDEKDHGGRYDYQVHGYAYEDSWNREHVWPKSHGFPDDRDTAYTDLHHIRPADRTINTERNTRSFDYGTRLFVDNGGTDSTGCFTSEDWVWEPPDFVKGDIARMVFYMAVRYEGYIVNGERMGDLELVDAIVPKGNRKPVLGKLSTLLEWHALDPVDNWERRRNDVIYRQFQGNRNPFIDFPEYAGKIWAPSE